MKVKTAAEITGSSFLVERSVGARYKSEETVLDYELRRMR